MIPILSELTGKMATHFPTILYMKKTFSINFPVWKGKIYMNFFFKGFQKSLKKDQSLPLGFESLATTTKVSGLFESWSLPEWAKVYH